MTAEELARALAELPPHTIVCVRDEYGNLGRLETAIWTRQLLSESGQLPPERIELS